MRAVQAEQYFLEQAGRSDEAVALDQLLDKLELQYADAEEDETSDDLVIEYDMQELNDELMDKLGISEDDAQYAPEDEDEDDSEAVDENGETNDETQLDAEAAKEGAESDDEPAGDGENAGDSEDDQTEDESNPQPIPTTSEVRQNNAEIHNPSAERSYQLALLDLDGVVYRGKNPVEHAAESIRKAEGLGMTVEYTTNNSSRLQSVVADQLKGFDLDVEPWQVITSSVVAARMVARAVPQGAKVFVLGAQHLREEVAKQGLEVVDSAEDKPVAAIQGWYPDMSWNQMAQIAYAVEQGATYFVTNRDLTIPRELGIAPGCGSMIMAVINATGVEPVSSAGKPESAMYDEARLLAAHDGAEPVAKEACLAIGDRLDTDIEAGNRGGYDSLAVLTGVTNPHELMFAPEHLRPTYIAKDLTGLNEPAPEVVHEAGAWSCRDVQACVDGDRLYVTDITSVDGLRAACAAMWDAADRGHSVDGMIVPEFRIA